MTTSMHRIINVQTNEITDVEFTSEELEAYAEAAKVEQDRVNAKTTAKAALLDRLGITADEAVLLLS